MAFSSGLICGNQWQIEDVHQRNDAAQSTFVETDGVSSNVLCMPMAVVSSGPPSCDTSRTLPPASSHSSAHLECSICGQSNNGSFQKGSQLAPFSQLSPVELSGMTLEAVNSVCQGCAVLIQRIDYHHMLANSIRQGLKICADAKDHFQVPGDFIQLRCSLCPAQVPDRRALSAHLISHLQGGRLPCPVCGRSFSSWLTLRRHALAVHQGELLSRCRRCPAAFNSSAKLVAHKLAQHGAAESLHRYRCPVCRRRFSRAHRYAAHLRSHGAAAAGELRRTLIALTAGQTSERVMEPDPPASEDQTANGEMGERRTAAAAEEEEEEEQTDIGSGNGDSGGGEMDTGEWRDSDGDEAVDDPRAEGEGAVMKTDDSDSAAWTNVLSSAPAAEVVKSDSGNSFRCNQCNKMFKRKQSLERHIGAMHKPSENLKCDECGKSFSIKFYWQKHMNRHRDKQEQCAKCQRQFVNRRALKRHKCVAENIPAVPAPLPPPAVAIVPVVQVVPVETVAIVANGDAGGPCPVCRRPAVTGDAPEQPRLGAEDPQPLASCSCGRLPSVPRGDTQSSTSTGPAQQEPFPCETCGESFATLGQLSVHHRSHREPRAHVCRTCGAVFPSAAELRKHSSRHRERSFQCSVCGKCFRWKNNLDIHARIHADERPYQCDICGHATRCSANLRLHKQRVHSTQRPHECPTCKKTFKERYILAIHMRSHTGERPYVCEFCGDGFVTKGKLNSHMTKHSEQRPHECPLCLKGFKTSAILGKHCRKVHGQTVDEAAARVGLMNPLPPPPPPAPQPLPLPLSLSLPLPQLPDTVPLGHRPEAQHYLPEFAPK